MLGSRLAYEKRFMSLTFFWFVAAAIIGMLDLYWMDNRFAKVQFDGKVWEAEIAYTSGESLTPGQYKIWKILPNRLVLIRA